MQLLCCLLWRGRRSCKAGHRVAAGDQLPQIVSSDRDEALALLLRLLRLLRLLQLLRLRWLRVSASGVSE